MLDKQFEDYLEQIFMDLNPEVLDDDLIDAFEIWLSNLDSSEIIHYAGEYGRKQYLLGQASVLKQNENN